METTRSGRPLPILSKMAHWAATGTLGLRVLPLSALAALLVAGLLAAAGTLDLRALPGFAPADDSQIWSLRSVHVRVEHFGIPVRDELLTSGGSSQSSSDTFALPTGGDATSLATLHYNFPGQIDPTQPVEFGYRASGVATSSGMPGTPATSASPSARFNGGNGSPLPFLCPTDPLVERPRLFNTSVSFADSNINCTADLSQTTLPDRFTWSMSAFTGFDYFIPGQIGRGRRGVSIRVTATYQRCVDPSQCIDIEGYVYTEPEPDLELPLVGVPVTLLRNGVFLGEAVTDVNGRYLLANAPLTDTLVLSTTLRNNEANPSPFRIRYDFNGPEVAVATAPFATSGTTGPVRKDVIWVDGRNTPPLTTLPVLQPHRDRFDDLAAIYYHTYQAWEFSDRTVSQVLDYNLPHEVMVYGSQFVTLTTWIGPWTDGTVNSPVPYTYIGANDSAYGSPNRPKNREWHEFAHHVMADMFSHAIPVNPGDQFFGLRGNSFSNAATTDSWVQGFAEFYALAVAKYIDGDPTPWIYVSENLESNYGPRSNEQFAVAGLLWDLIDEANLDDRALRGGQTYADCVEISIGSLWSVLDTDWGDALEQPAGAPAGYPYIFDVKHLYDVLKIRGVGASHSRGGPLSDLDELFMLHGLFADTNDSRGLDPGETIGRSADQARPERRQAPRIPGSYIRYRAVDAQSGATTTLDTVVIDVQFEPPFDYFNYSVRVTPDADGRIYYFGPDASYPATTSIRAVAGSQVSTEPLTFSNEFYWQQMASEPDEHFVEHQFTMAQGPGLYLPNILNLGGARGQQGLFAAAPMRPQQAVPCAGGSPTPTPTPTPTLTPTPTPTRDPGAPVVESISPNSTAPGVAVQVTIKGKNFQGGANPFIGNTPIQNVTRPDAETIIGTVPATLAEGTYDVVVVNPGGLTNLLANGFVVAKPGAPTLTATPTPTLVPIATATATATPTATPTATDTSGGLTQEEILLNLINQERVDNGLAALQDDDRLAQAAARHSRDLADNDITGSEGSDGSTAAQRIEEAGYAWTQRAELRLWGSGVDAEKALEAWLANESSRDILLKAIYIDIGIGYSVGDNPSRPDNWVLVLAAP